MCVTLLLERRIEQVMNNTIMVFSGRTFSSEDIELIKWTRNKYPYLKRRERGDRNNKHELAKKAIFMYPLQKDFKEILRGEKSYEEEMKARQEIVEISLMSCHKIMFEVLEKLSRIEDPRDKRKIKHKMQTLLLYIINI